MICGSQVLSSRCGRARSPRVWPWVAIGATDVTPGMRAPARGRSPEGSFDLSVEVPGLRTYDRARIIYEWLAKLGAEDQWTAAFDQVENITAVLAQEPLSNPRVVKRALTRLSLLVEARGDVVARIGRTHAEADRSVPLRRLVAWVAGTERFRTFRAWLRSATLNEVVQLFRLVESQQGGGDAAASGASQTIRELVATPGFGLFLTTRLGIAEDRCHTLTTPSQGGMEPGSVRWHDPTLHDMDELLREVGL